MGFAARDDNAVALGRGWRHGFLQMFGQAARIARGGSLALWRPQPIDQASGAGAERHLGQRPASGLHHQRAQFWHVVAQPGGVLRGGPERYFHQLRHARQAQRVGQHQRAFEDGRHQPCLVVHQYQLGVVRVEQHAADGSPNTITKYGDWKEEYSSTDMGIEWTKNALD